MKTAVAVHGCHVGAVDWESIVWGDPKHGVYGRAATAISLAWENSAEMLSFSTGASERDGRREAERIYELARSRLDELFGGPVKGLDTAWLEKIAVIDVESQNTADEMRYLGQSCTEREIEKLFLVSSPWHIMRCLKEALAYQAVGGFAGMHIYTLASDDSSDDLNAGNVVVLEPPHRGDDPMLHAPFKMHEIIPKLFGLSHKDRIAILAELDSMISRRKL